MRLIQDFSNSAGNPCVSGRPIMGVVCIYGAKEIGDVAAASVSEVAHIILSPTTDHVG
jgi:hypothetical protein